MSYNFPKICLKCTPALIFLLFFHTVSAQYDFSAVDEIIGDKKQQAGGNASIVIWKDGQVIYKKDTGSLKMGKMEVQIPAEAASRWFTAALTLIFVDEGLLSLDDPVSNYLPIFSKYSKSYLTIRQCLNNTTGIEPEGGKMLQKKKFASLEEQVNYIASHYDIRTNPGTEFVYGNTGLDIVGRVLEVISKRKTFDRLANEKIFRPLTMRKTSFMVETGAVRPSTGALSTSGDYCKFLALLMSNGQFNGKQIISEASIKELHKMQINNEVIKYIPPVMKEAGYGLGVFLEEEGKLISCPSFTGIWPFIDYARNYCGVIVTPAQRAAATNQDFYRQVKDALDEAMSLNSK